MDFLSTKYIISQIFTIIMFVFLGISYYCEDRKKVIILNILAQTFQLMVTILLNGYTGALMSIVMIINCIISYIFYCKKIDIKDNYLILIILLFLVFIFSIIGYNGIFSLLSVFATIILLLNLVKYKKIWLKN